MATSTGNSSASSVNRVSQPVPAPRRRYRSTQSNTGSSSSSECSNCGRKGHRAGDAACKARGQACRNCGRDGHFAAKCRSPSAVSDRSRPCQTSQPIPKPRKYGSTQSSVKSVASSHVRSIDDDLHDEHVYQLACAVDDGERLSLRIDGVQEGVVIDSGASCNVMSRDRLAALERRGLRVSMSQCSRKLFAYGRSELDVLGSFAARTRIGTQERSVEFVVVSNPGPTLLGRQPALDFGVLSLPATQPAEVNSVSSPDNMCRQRLESEFPTVFSGIGLLKGYQATVHIDPSVPPVAQKPRPIPFALREKVAGKVDELLDTGIIEPVQGPTPWVSPIVVAPKPNGDIRLCIDMRRVNEAVIRERYPFLTVDEALQQLNGATTFSKLDLRAGFHQIELDEESRNLTVFATPSGLFRYRRMMFGLSSAPEQYQHIIQQVLSGCPGCVNIADDLVVFGLSAAEHDRNLRVVLNSLAERGLTVNSAKCSFRQDTITFFGLQLSRTGITPTPEKVEAVRDAPEPTNASEVRSFLGVVGFSSRFIPDMSSVTESLRRISQKGAVFEWGEPQARAFQMLKQKLTSAVSLAYFDVNADTEVIADASPVGLGAVLVQTQGGVRRAISYASRTLSDVERRYSQTEKEALALVWACERFRQFLLGRKFFLVTDHQPLKAIYSPRSKPSARVERWVLRLQEYDFQVRYIPGHQNIADALSRLPVTPAPVTNQIEESIGAVTQAAAPVALKIQDVEQASERDPELQVVRQCLLSDDWTTAPATYAAARYELASVGFVILCGTRIVVPQELRSQVLALAHEGHQGIAKTKSRLRSKVWWPGIDRDAEATCRRCVSCQVVAGPPHTPPPVMSTALPSGPWQYLAIDLLGPLPSGNSLLVTVDYHSRFFEVDILRSTSSTIVIEKLQAHFARHGLPTTLRSDNGPQFVSSEFSEFLHDHGIQHQKTTPYWPRANGEVKRQNRTILKALQIAQLESKPWRTELHKLLVAYRTTPHSATGRTPSELLFNRQVRTKLPSLLFKEGEDTALRDRDSLSKYRSAECVSKKRPAPAHQELQPGEQVLVKRTSAAGKLDAPFLSEPHQIISRTGDQLMLQSPDGVVKKRNVHFAKRLQTEHPLPSQEPDEQTTLVPLSPEVPKQTTHSSSRTSDSTEVQPTESESAKPTYDLRAKRDLKIPCNLKDYVMY